MTAPAEHEHLVRQLELIAVHVYNEYRPVNSIRSVSAYEDPRSDVFGALAIVPGACSHPASISAPGITIRHRTRNALRAREHFPPKPANYAGKARICEKLKPIPSAVDSHIEGVIGLARPDGLQCPSRTDTIPDSERRQEKMGPVI
jgi:hypothetical protein